MKKKKEQIRIKVGQPPCAYWGYEPTFQGIKPTIRVIEFIIEWFDNEVGQGTATIGIKSKF